MCVAHAALTNGEVVESLDDARARDLLHALAETPLPPPPPPPLLLLLPLLVVLLAGELPAVPSRSGES